MNERHENAHRMHAAVLDLLDRHADTWRARPPVAEAVGALRAAVADAARLESERNALGTTGLTAEKGAARDAVEALTFGLVLALRPYARATDDRDLLARVDLSAYQLDRARDARLIGHAEQVRDAATEHLDALAGAGYT